jgi:hypothetical protein
MQEARSCRAFTIFPDAGRAKSSAFSQSFDSGFGSAESLDGDPKAADVAMNGFFLFAPWAWAEDFSLAVNQGLQFGNIANCDSLNILFE